MNNANIASARSIEGDTVFNEVQFSESDMASFMPRPPHDANKYTRGVLHAVCGAAAYPGAAVLAARAAQRAGAGYTQVWCAQESVAVVQAGAPSVVARAWEVPALTRTLAAAEKKRNHPCAVLIGCGFTGNGFAGSASGMPVGASDMPADKDTVHGAGNPQEAGVGAACANTCAETAANERALLRAVLASNLPVLVDGGALSCLAHLVAVHGCDFLAARAKRGAHLVLTPHAGEADRLLNALSLDKTVSQGKPCNKQSTTHTTNPNAFAADSATQVSRAHALAETYAATVVLKGPQTIVANNREYYVMNAGTPALAKAGTGDVLAGIIAALLAQGTGAFVSGVLGSYVHAKAGRCAEQHKGCVSVIPEDVIDCIPRAIQALLI